MISERLFAFADRFLPTQPRDPEQVRLLRMGVLLGWLAVVFTGVFGPLYWLLESAWSGATIVVVNQSILWSIFAIKRGVSIHRVQHITTATTWAMTFVVAWRTGGFISPALVWNFIPPLTTYLISGSRASAFWSAVCALQIVFFYVAELLGVTFLQELSPGVLSLLRMSGYAGFVGAMLTLIALVEGVRSASLATLAQASRVLEAERILQDMHDGVGNQLLGLLMDVRSGRINQTQISRGLENCLDDLRLIVDSLDSSERSIETGIAEMRARFEPRCQSLGIALQWDVNIASELPFSADTSLQLLRALQELISNAIKHSHATRIHVEIKPPLGAPHELELKVSDDGVGFDAEQPPRVGRGLRSLRTRAARLKGQLALRRTDPGTQAVLRFTPS
jgi:signal transduction histidine kinase